MRQRIVGAVRWRREYAAEWAFDRRRRIRTAGVFRDHATPYQPVHPAAFAELLSHVDCDRAATTFVDVGSGRGRALFLAVEHRFGAAVGVEIEATHHAVATENLQRYGPAPIRLVHGDARELELPPGPLVLFVYNPFPRAAMVDFVARTARSLRAGPRPAWVIYEAPLDRDLFDAEPVFELVAERTERTGASPRCPRFAIYRANS
jgi:SAM-dependent methyltransferase